MGGKQDVLLPDNLHISVRLGVSRYDPVSGDLIWQVLRLDIKVYGAAIALRGEASVPGHKVHVKVTGFDAADQCVIEDVLFITDSGIPLH